MTDEDVRLCAVCDAPVANQSSLLSIYCEPHRDRSTRPPREQWRNPDVRQIGRQFGGPGKKPTDTEEDTSPEAPPASPYSSPGNGKVEDVTAATTRWWRRLWSKKGDGDTKPSKERAPRPPRGFMGKRISMADDASELYGHLGSRFEASKHFPAGRMMAYQADAFGIVLDKAVAGTLIDRIAVQPLMRTKDRWEPVLDLTLPPILLIGMKNALDDGNMNAFNAMAPMLEYVVDRSLTALLPAMAEAEACKAERAAAIAEHFPGLTGVQAPTGEVLSPAQALISMLFVHPSHVQPQPEGNPDGEGIRAHPQTDREGAMGV